MRITGTYTALVTPFQTDGSIDEGALRASVEAQIVAGIDGLVPCGTTGETPTLSQEEAERVIRVTVEETRGRVPVMAGTGSYSTKQAIENTQRAKALGCDAALVVTPYYNKPGPAMLEAHFKAVAAEGGLPMCLYNVPGRTGCNMLPATVAALSRVPNIVAIKEASGNLVQMQEVLFAIDSERFTVLSGDDAMSLGLYACGGHGVVSVASNVLPAETTAIYRAFASGDVAGATAMNRRLFALFQTLFIEPNPVPCKVAQSLLGRMGPTVRMPLGAAQPKTIDAMRAVLTGLGLL